MSPQTLKCGPIMGSQWNISVPQALREEEVTKPSNILMTITVDLDLRSCLGWKTTK